jgi:hypothetical protein
VFYLKKCVVTTLEEVRKNYNIFYLYQYPTSHYLPLATQMTPLSTILPYDILEATTKFMTDPIRIIVKRDELTWEGNQGITQPSPEYI